MFCEMIHSWHFIRPTIWAFRTTRVKENNFLGILLYNSRFLCLKEFVVILKGNASPYIRNEAPRDWVAGPISQLRKNCVFIFLSIWFLTVAEERLDEEEMDWWLRWVFRFHLSAIPSQIRMQEQFVPLAVGKSLLVANQEAVSLLRFSYYKGMGSAMQAKCVGLPLFSFTSSQTWGPIMWNVPGWVLCRGKDQMPFSLNVCAPLS
jgi:hypothetical protein